MYIISTIYIKDDSLLSLVECINEIITLLETNTVHENEPFQKEIASSHQPFSGAIR